MFGLSMPFTPIDNRLVNILVDFTKTPWLMQNFTDTTF